jgi:hypothetical protein
MCIKAAADCNSDEILDEILGTHLCNLGHAFSISQVTCIMPNLIVACAQDDHVQVLRTLLKHQEPTNETLKAAFIRAAASGAILAVEELANRPTGIDPVTGTEAILEAFAAGQIGMVCHLFELGSILYFSDLPKIIAIHKMVYTPTTNHNGVYSEAHLMSAAVLPEVVLPLEEFVDKDVPTFRSDPAQETQSGWSLWGIWTGLKEMATNVVVRLYYGIPSIIIYEKRDLDEFWSRTKY